MENEPILSAPEAQKPPAAEPMTQDSIAERIAMASEMQHPICVKARFSPNGDFGLSVFDSLSEMYNAGYVKGFLAASTAPGWISVKRKEDRPDEDTAVLVAVMNEAENHGTGEFVKFPETVRGTIYSHQNGVTADTDCGEFNDDEILGWQHLPIPPLAAPPAPHKEGD